jgi:NitT/TauT family transport system permease protein
LNLRVSDAILRIAGTVAFVLLWEAAVRVFAIPAYMLPLPSDIAYALIAGIRSGTYTYHLGVTLVETLLGFVLGTALAFVLGSCIALSRRTEYFIYPSILMFQALPKVALAPLIVIWFGLGISSKVVNAALISFFPLMINTIAGLRSVDGDRVDLMRAMAASDLQIFVMLRLPNALPYIMAGLEVAMVFSLIGAIVAEFIGAQAGLGMLIQSMNFSADTAGIFAVLILLAIMGLVLNQALVLVRRRLLFWSPAERSITSVPVEKLR